MSESNKQLVRRALEEIYTGGNLGLATELFHPDFIDHEPAHPEQPTGPESVMQTVQRLRTAFGDVRFELQDEIAEGDKVVELVIMSGRRTGPLIGSEPTAKTFAVRHIYIWRIADIGWPTPTTGFALSTSGRRRSSSSASPRSR